MKIGVLVVAYNAESTLRWVLDRIPVELRTDLVEVLVMDDHSADATFDVAHEYIADGTDIPLTIIRHDSNLGYGGNQKAGYRYAIEHGWDVVVLLHGDGQYAPEKMPDLLAPFTDPSAHPSVDAVFGSRMLDPGGARRGGMPLYKYVGNRILTRTQNLIAGVDLSEWHSGYRAYRVSALAELPFVGNSDGFPFDTEIILQLLGSGRQIREVPIPTYYGDEISRVNGIAYARAIVIDTIRHRLGQAGFGRGDLGHKDQPYAYKPSPDSSHGIVLEMIPMAGDLRVLDVGCGPGWVASELRRRGHNVTGVDLTADEGIAERTDRFFEADLEARATRRRRRRVRGRDRRRRDRARPQPRRTVGRPCRTHGEHRDDRGQRAELRALVSTPADRSWTVRLRPARHPRPDPRALLHTAQLPAGGRQHRPRHDLGTVRRAATRRARRRGSRSEQW